MYGIWDLDLEDWVRELPSKVDDGGTAALCFETRRSACRRAAKHWGYDSYSACKKCGFCLVIPIQTRRAARAYLMARY